VHDWLVFNCDALQWVAVCGLVCDPYAGDWDGKGHLHVQS